MQRRRLLRAFAEILAEEGLEDTNVGRVCRRAGVSRRTFYDLFDDREACFLAAFDSAIVRISRGIAPVYAGESSTLKDAPHGGHAGWRERVRRALTVLLEVLEDEPAVARMCLVEAHKAGTMVMERRRGVLDVLSAIVDQGRSESKGATGPPPLTAQSTVGGAVSVLQARVLESDPEPLVDLLNPLMSMIVLPYLGPAAARRELERSAPRLRLGRIAPVSEHARDPFKDLPIRITLRTARVLTTIATKPSASNREIGDAAGVPDQGQISKLLRRLAGYGLIENRGLGHARGEPNAWQLTERGHAIQRTIDTSAAG